MKQLTRSSYSWWRDSHNSPRQSAWLQSTLEELEEKTQNMLNLVEAEADSFAQRAENFYHKRPQLVNMIEELYRAYRSLAEQYDHLKGEIRQNVPKAIQDEYGLSLEAHLESPFRKQIPGVKNLNQGFKKLLRRQERSDSDSEVSEVDDPEPENCNRRSKRCSYQKSISISTDRESASALSYLDSEVDSHVHEPSETENVGSKMREMQVNILHLQEDNAMLLKQLTTRNTQIKHLKFEINKLKKEKAFCKEETSLVVQDRSLLQNELDIINAENTKLRNDNEVNVWERNDLQKELDFIKEENTKLRNENGINLQQLQVVAKKVRNLQKENKNYKTMSLVFGCVNGQAARLARSNVRLRNEMCGTVRILEEKKKVGVILGAEENMVSEQSFKIKELQSDVCNRKQELDIIRTENTKLRNENEINAQNIQFLTEMISNLQKENTKFCQQNNMVSEQSFKIKELQSDVCNSKQELDIIRAENTKVRNENEVNAQKIQFLTEKVSNLQKENTKFSKQNKIMSAVLGFFNGQAASLARSNLRLRKEMCGGNRQGEDAIQTLKDDKKNVEIIKQRNENEVNAQVKVLSEKVGSLEKENTNLSRQNKIMSAVLAFANSQSPRLATSNAMCQGYCQSEATVEILKDEKLSAENILEAKEKLVSELNLTMEELQMEACHLRADNSKLRDENEVNLQKLQALTDNVCNLQKENTKLFRQSKDTGTILEAKENFLLEQSFKIKELQNEVCHLLDENREQDIKLIERDEQKREAIRQLCLSLDALRDKNKRLQKALQKSRGGEGRSKPNNIGFNSTHISSWKKVLFSVMEGGSRPIAI